MRRRQYSLTGAYLTLGLLVAIYLPGSLHSRRQRLKERRHVVVILVARRSLGVLRITALNERYRTSCDARGEGPRGDRRADAGSPSERSRLGFDADDGITIDFTVTVNGGAVADGVAKEAAEAALLVVGCANPPCGTMC